MLDLDTHYFYHLPTNQHYIGPSGIELGSLKQCLGFEPCGWKNAHFFQTQYTHLSTFI